MIASPIETRIKKWQIYRNEIINEGILIDKIANESIVATRYKEKIDKLNKNILYGIHNNRSLAKLISIDENKMLEVKSLQKFIDLIDDTRLVTIDNEINEWLSKYRRTSIIDEHDKISQSWLIEDENYSEISTTINDIEILSNRWAKFQFDSKAQLIKINSLEKNDKTKIILNDLSTIKPNEENIKKFNKLFYIIPSIASVVFLLAAIVLLVIKIGEV